MEGMDLGKIKRGEKRIKGSLVKYLFLNMILYFSVSKRQKQIIIIIIIVINQPTKIPNFEIAAH